RGSKRASCSLKQSTQASISRTAPSQANWMLSVASTFSSRTAWGSQYVRVKTSVTTAGISLRLSRERCGPLDHTPVRKLGRLVPVPAMRGGGSASNTLAKTWTLRDRVGRARLGKASTLPLTGRGVDRGRHRRGPERPHAGSPVGTERCVRDGPKRTHGGTGVPVW